MSINVSQPYIQILDKVEMNVEDLYIAKWNGIKNTFSSD